MKNLLKSKVVVIAVLIAAIATLAGTAAVVWAVSSSSRPPKESAQTRGDRNLDGGDALDDYDLDAEIDDDEIRISLGGVEPATAGRRWRECAVCNGTGEAECLICGGTGNFFGVGGEGSCPKTQTCMWCSGEGGSWEEFGDSSGGGNSGNGSSGERTARTYQPNTVQPRTPQKCAACDGFGYKQCTSCGGTGKIEKTVNSPYYGGSRVTDPKTYNEKTFEICRTCAGGRFPAGSVDCMYCNGKGFRE